MPDHACRSVFQFACHSVDQVGAQQHEVLSMIPDFRFFFPDPVAVRFLILHHKSRIHACRPDRRFTQKRRIRFPGSGPLVQPQDRRSQWLHMLIQADDRIPDCRDRNCFRCRKQIRMFSSALLCRSADHFIVIICILFCPVRFRRNICRLMMQLGNCENRSLLVHDHCP